uniref:Putative amino acid transporter n=1 Tax=Ornithodoros turicata TaxID=34597 RepID=A0A2R5L8M9_9ACAR
MAGDRADLRDSYSPLVGLVYIFNLIVGTGALTMPAAFKDAGWALSLAIVILLALMSYLTTTFVIEAMASTNALVHGKTLKHYKRVVGEEEGHIAEGRKEYMANELRTDEIIARSVDLDERVPLLISNAAESMEESSHVDYFAIKERFELGKMASLYFNKLGINLFYICIAIYLYGDLAIYAAAVSKSLRDVTCTASTTVPNVTNGSAKDMGDLQCWSGAEVSRTDAYRIYVLAFLCLLGPFTFFNMQKTKYLQLFTTLMRWIAFSSMIILCTIALSGGKGRGQPPVADPTGLPNLFGVCVYAFMCHHSLPSLVTPMKSKRHLFALVGADYLLILGFYTLLAFTGIFTFPRLHDMYTLNFQPTDDPLGSIVPAIPFLQYFLSLFPVFTLSTSFPIIAITLRNNLKALFLREERSSSSSPTSSVASSTTAAPSTLYKILERFLLPLLAILPPIIVAFATENVEFLVGITGSYAGAVIQYIVPVALVYCARNQVFETLGLGVRNQHASVFRHSAWLVFVLLWAVTCVTFVTVNHFLSKF